MSYSFSLNNSQIKSRNKIISLFKNHAAVQQESQQKTQYLYFDTFDWRLYSEGYCLYVLNKEIFLYNYKKNKPIITQTIGFRIHKGILEFENQIRKHLDPYIGVRSLLLRCSLTR